VPEAAVRVVARDVGGNFGTRNSFYPEFALVAWAARRLRRPVKWTCERREAFLSDYQARDLVSEMELALDADGTFLALRGVNTSNVGAHTVTFVPLNKGRELATSVYRLPAACVRGRAVLSNTSPLAAYRSAGRPQVMFVTCCPRSRPRSARCPRRRTRSACAAAARAARRPPSAPSSTRSWTRSPSSVWSISRCP
jgi:carbon-monoxide dehydrogenase large subunit